MKTGHLAGVISLIAGSAIQAQTIYNDLDSGTDGVAWAGDLVLDDLRVDGSGLVTTVTVALASTAGAQVTNVSLSLALDGGDGFPDLDGTGDDSFLFQTFRPGVAVPDGAIVEVTFDITPFWATVPEEALLFGGLMIENPAVGHVFYGSPTVGTTDGIVWSFAQGGPVPVPSAGDPELPDSDALAFRVDVVELPGQAPGRGVIGKKSGFEAQGEGTLGTIAEIDGVTFSSGRDGFPPPEDGTFVIDDGTGVWTANPAMLDFVQGKLLQLNAFGPGSDNYVFSLLKSFEMSSDTIHTGARLNVAYISRIVGETNFATSEITLLARLGETMVATDVINADRELGESGSGSFTFGAGTLEISGVEFDSLVLFCNGPGPFGGVQMGIDNLVLGLAACPGDADLDDEIDFADLLFVLGAWGPCPPDAECPADLNDDGAVTFADLLIVLGNWGDCIRK